MARAYHHRMPRGQSQVGSLMHVEPSLVRFLFLSQHFLNSLFILRVELPVQYGNITIIELISRIAQYVLVEHDSLWLYLMLFFMIIVGNECFSKLIGCLVKNPAIWVHYFEVPDPLVLNMTLKGVLKSVNEVYAALPVMNIITFRHLQ